jgi:hypothetical protein
MAVLTSYGPLLGGYRNASSERLWDKPARRAGVLEEPVPMPFGTRAPPLRKELPDDLLNEQGPPAQRRGERAAGPAAGAERPIRDNEVAFLLDFNAPFLRAVSQVQSPSDVVFRERAVYWDLAPARAAYGKILYRQNSFFVNRKQDSGLGVNLNSFW